VNLVNLVNLLKALIQNIRVCVECLERPLHELHPLRHQLAPNVSDFTAEWAEVTEVGRNQARGDPRCPRFGFDHGVPGC